MAIILIGGSALLIDHYAFAIKPGAPPPTIERVNSCTGTKVAEVDQSRLHYPSCWTLGNYADSSMMTTVVAFISNQTMHPPCVTKKSGIGTTTSCGFPIKSLNHAGALIMVVEGGMPGWTISKETGRYFVVDHHPARESVSKKHLRSLNATEEISVSIDAGVPDNYYQIVGFFRGPGVANDTRRFNEMVTTFQIH
jgi:hypothetical protein